MSAASQPGGAAPWAALLAAGVVVEVWALRTGRDEGTLSHATRRAFRTDTRGGRLVFVCGWAALSWWWLPHILRDMGTDAPPPASILL